MTAPPFRAGESVYWLRPSVTGDGSIERIPAQVLEAGRLRVTIEAWGGQGRTRIVKVSPECVSRLETIGEVLDRIEQRGRKDSD